jgi:hypothetical protein
MRFGSVRDTSKVYKKRVASVSRREERSLKKDPI